jgi:hypothetical protein
VRECVGCLLIVVVSEAVDDDDDDDKRSLPWDHRAPYILIEPSYNETSRNDLALFTQQKDAG